MSILKIYVKSLRLSLNTFSISKIKNTKAYPTIKILCTRTNKPISNEIL